MDEPVAVLVIGGGPAGATAAMTLATAGLRVRVLERHRFPRDKPCGGGLRYGAWRRFPWLRELGARVAFHPIHRVHMVAPSGASVTVERREPLYVTFRRLEFDRALVERARALGAEVVEGARVVDVTREATGVAVRCGDGRTFRARMVIAADGVHGVVARALGLARPPHELVALDTTEESPELVPADAATMYVAYGYAGGPGYGYVFPKRGCVDAGVGFLVGFFRGSGRSPRAWHARFVEDAGCRGWLAGPSSPARVRAWHLPLAGPLPRTVTDRAVVCGDAGGFVNAYTGEGIYYAMVTGEHAGAAAMAALREGAPSAAALASYERRWRAEVGAELADSRRIQRHLFRHPGLVDALIRGAAADGRLRELLAQVALGEARFRRCAWAVALRLARAELRRRWPGGRRRGGVRS